MSVPLRDPIFEPFYSSFDGDDESEDRFALSPGERIVGPRDRTSDALAWLVSITIILGAGWFLTRDPAGWMTTLADLSARALGVHQSQNNPAESSQNIASAAAPPASQPMQPPASQSASPPASQQQAPQLKPAPSAVEATAPSAPKNDVEAASKDKSVAKDDIKTASLPSPEHNAEASAHPPPKTGDRDDALSDYSPARLEVPQPQDRYQARAESVGLHPSLSHAVLERFSPTDFRNARKAIDTAVAQTPDSGVFIWPRRREPGRALFRVHFVAGAGPDCRRYVVTVTMNGWTTTALPMEKCGVRRVAAKK